MAAWAGRPEHPRLRTEEQRRSNRHHAQGRYLDITALVRAIEGRHSEDVFPARLSPAQWQELAGVMVRRELRPGELLMRRGDTDTAAFLVEQGQLQVFVTGGPPRSHRIATLREGAMIGEPGLFGATPRMAHVEAMTSCVVWSLCAVRLQQLAEQAPVLVLEVLRAAGAVMARRMRSNLERGIPVI
jgi:CRP-like cAMP-binding protein